MMRRRLMAAVAATAFVPCALAWQTEPPTRNLLTNGGAERGWYGTHTADLEAMTETGRNIQHDGQTYVTPLVTELDTVERHSGRASFKLTANHAAPKMAAFAHYNLGFNQVPYVKGKPIVWSAWMKADRPGVHVWMRLHVGGSYIKDIKLTTEWKRYVSVVPAVGQKTSNCYGTLGNGYACVTPRIDILSPGTVWIDDAAVFQATEGDYVAPPLDFTGVLDKDGGVYYAGEPVVAKLKLALPAGAKGARKVRLSSTAYDFRGNAVATVLARTVEVGETPLAFDETLPLPAERRGALRWLIEADGEKVGLFFGVVDGRKPPVRRFGENLYKMSNIPWVIDMMRDFRVGAARVWDAKIYDYTSTVDQLHRAGIDVLYCFANAGVLGLGERHLVEKDTSAWEAHIADVVTKNLGKVSVYEILNEPNARSGMGKNPDPAKYDLITPQTNVRIIETAAKTIRKHDRKTLIGGPTTCHTDISWTLDVLGRGAAKDLDVITEHPYCTLPEVPDYARQLRTLSAAAAQLKGRPMPTLATERGKETPSDPPDGQMLRRDVDGAGLILRTMIVSYAGGSGCFYDFQLTSFNTLLGYNQVYGGNPDNHGKPRPSLVLYAQRALLDLIEDHPFSRAFDVGSSARAYSFDRGRDRVVALWRFRGDPLEVRLPRPFEVVDFMGTRRTADVLVLDRFPQYLVTPMTDGELEKLFAQLDFGPEEKVVEEKRPQTKVPYFENAVDWEKAAKFEASDPKRPGERLDVRFAWNRAGLRMRAVVTKRGFHPDGSLETTMWKGDSLQVGFDTLKNADRLAKDYDDDDFEYDIARFRGKDVAYRRRASLAIHDSLHKPLGVVDDVQVAITPGEAATVYEVTFAPQAVSPLKLGAGESMRLSVAANLSDGKARYGTLAIAGGLATYPKHPYDFLEIVLSDESAEAPVEAMSEGYRRLWNAEVQAAIDARIERHRKADAAADGFRPGSSVRVEQVTHGFRFGAHIFNFDQLGRKDWNDLYKSTFTNLLNAATVAYYWGSYEPVRGSFRHAAGPHDNAAFWDSVASLSPKEKYERFVEYRRPAPDPILDFCAANGIDAHGHAMIYRVAQPDWVTNAAPSDAEQIDLYRAHIRELAEHAGTRVSQWDVVNESVRRDAPVEAPDDTVFWGPNPPRPVPAGYTLACFDEAAKRLPKGVRAAINEACVIDDVYLAFVKSLLDRGAKIDTVGLQFHIFNAKEMLGLAKGEHKGRRGYCYSPERILQTLAKADRLGRPIHISEITVPAPEESAWGEAVQAEALRDLYRLWFSWPSVDRITYWNLVDFTYHKESLSSGFYARDMRKKAVWHAMDKLLNQEWKTRTTVTADAAGRIAFRGFRGTYRLVGTGADGRQVERRIVVR